MSAATEAWTAWATFRRLTAAERAEYARAAADRDLTEAGRTARMREIRERYTEAHTARFEPVAKAEPAVVRQWFDAQAPAQEARAAAQAPDAATSTRALAEGATVDTLRALVDDAVHRASLAKAHGIREALRTAVDMDEDARGELLQRLDKIGAPARDRALVELVAFRHALAGFGADRESLDGVGILANPLRALQAAREAGTIPLPDGRTMTLPEAAVLEMVVASGIPATPPPIPDTAAAAAA
jgi:hypothetical protein